jgi:hypothetical protein
MTPEEIRGLIERLDIFAETSGLFRGHCDAMWMRAQVKDAAKALRHTLELRAAVIEECAKVMCHRCGEDEAPIMHQASLTWCHPNRHGLLVACASDAILSLKATPTQSQLEEPGTGDEVAAASQSAGLTQNRTEAPNEH